MFIQMPPPVTEEYAERMGFHAGWNGPDTTNCNFAIFAKLELTKAWERGKRRAEQKRHSGDNS